MKKIFATLFILTILVPNVSFAVDGFIYKVKVTATEAILTSKTYETLKECKTALDTTIAKGTSTIYENCKSNIATPPNDIVLYYFSYSSDGIKLEQGEAGKETCEKIRTSDYYKNLSPSTSCYTPSKQKELDTENTKTAAGRIQNIGTQGSPRDDSYHLLAPIGDFNVVEKSKGIGDYLNQIFVIGIGLAGALAVVMIVINGIVYMGNESVFGKTQAKERILMAIGGLILALGSWVVLNTLNPDLVGGSLSIQSVDVLISADDTSTGSSKDPSLCLSKTNPLNPDTANGSTITLNSSMQEYKKNIDSLTSISTGRKLLMTAQTHVEGFFPGSKSYRTNNPGNIGNTDDGKTRTFGSLKEGIEGQVKQTANGINGVGSYKIGIKYDCALGGEVYDGSLYQYLRIYSTGARKSNAYVNAIIGYFKANGKNINARTKMSEINNIK